MVTQLYYSCDDVSFLVSDACESVEASLCLSHKSMSVARSSFNKRELRSKYQL